MDGPRVGSLAEVVATQRVVVCVGCGGVGKTTTTAALAVHAALQGRRVLCLTIDPARRLADSLGITAARAEEHQVDPASFEAFGLHCKGSLTVLMLDTKTTFDQLIQKYAKTSERRDRILRNKIYQQISGALAGTQEYMAMEKLYEMRARSDFDLILLDTPPTSHALDFLDAPDRLIDAIDSQAMRWFTQAFKEASKLSLNLLGKGAALVLKSLAKFTGAAFLSDVGEFVTGINELFGGFRHRAREVAESLRSSEVSYIIVTRPDPLAIEEARFFRDRLITMDIKRFGFVVNAVHCEYPIAALDAEATRRLRAFVASSVDVESFAGALGRAAEHENALAAQDQSCLSPLRHGHAGAMFYVEVPVFEEELHHLAGLAKLAQRLVQDETEGEWSGSRRATE